MSRRCAWKQKHAGRTSRQQRKKISNSCHGFNRSPLSNRRIRNSTIQEPQIRQGKFIEMPERNLVSYNSMISGLPRGGCYTEALGMFMRLQEDCVGGFCLDEFTVASVVSCCASFRGLGLVRQLHGVGLVLGLEKNLVLLNSLIDAYGKGGEFDFSLRVFRRMNERDVVSWTSMVAAYTPSS